MGETASVLYPLLCIGAAESSRTRNAGRNRADRISAPCRRVLRRREAVFQTAVVWGVKETCIKVDFVGAPRCQLVVGVFGTVFLHNTVFPKRLVFSDSSIEDGFRHPLIVYVELVHFTDSGRVCTVKRLDAASRLLRHLPIWFSLC